MHYFEYNDCKGLKKVIDEHRGGIAAIIFTPHRHDAFHDQELPTGEFIESVYTLAKAEGFLLIIDDVRCGFWLNLSGSATYFGYHADLN